MDQHQVGKIDGYLEAVSALKDDGTGFTFDRIGHSDDLSSEISKYFSSLGEILVVNPVKNWQKEVLPELSNWILKRHRIMNSGDGDSLEERIYDRFIEELLSSLENPIYWHNVSHQSENGNTVTIEAIWDCFIMSTPSGNFALYCGWDS